VARGARRVVRLAQNERSVDMVVSV